MSEKRRQPHKRVGARRWGALRQMPGVHYGWNYRHEVLEQTSLQLLGGWSSRSIPEVADH